MFSRKLSGEWSTLTLFLHARCSTLQNPTWTVLEVCRACPAGSFSPGLGAFSNKTCAQQLVSSAPDGSDVPLKKNTQHPMFVLKMGTKTGYITGITTFIVEQFFEKNSGRCSAGTWSETLGASSHSSCRACPVGTYSNLPGPRKKHVLEDPDKWFILMLIGLGELRYVMLKPSQMSATIMPYWFCCFLDVVLYNISLCDFVWLLIVTVWKNGSQPASVMIAGATSTKTCSACPKGTYQPIEAATGTASSEGCLLCFAVLRVLRNSQLRLQKRRYAFLVPWATTATRLDRRHVASARKAAITRNVWVGTLGFSHDGEWILMDVDVHWWKIDANEYHDWLRFLTSQVTMAMPLAWQHAGHAQRAPPPNRMVPFAQACAMRV